MMVCLVMHKTAVLGRVVTFEEGPDGSVVQGSACGLLVESSFV